MREPLKVLKNIFQKIDSVELTDFEKNYLIPGILDRLKFYQEQFEKIIPICDDPKNGGLMDDAVRKALSSTREEERLVPPELGQAYLRGVKKQVTDIYIADISAVLKQFPSPKTVDDGEKLYQLIQQAQRIAEMVVGCVGGLFRYRLRAFPVMIVEGRETWQRPSPEILIISYPFELILGEIEKSATSLKESLTQWAKGRQEMRKEYITYVTAVEQTRLARQLNWFQILVIIFAIVLALGSTRIIEFARELTVPTTTKEETKPSKTSTNELQGKRGEHPASAIVSK